MKRLTSFVIAATALVFIVLVCNHDNPSSPTDGSAPSIYEWIPLKGNSTGQSLERTSWKLLGIVEVKTGLLKRLEPECDWCYTLSFFDDSTFNTWSAINQYRGTYQAVKTVDYVAYRIDIENFDGSRYDYGYMNEEDQLWRNIFSTITNYALQDNELKLYYNNGKNYLLFTTQDDGKEWLTGTSWKLVEVSAYKDYQLYGNLNYADNNVIFEFLENGKLVIFGKIEEPFWFDKFKEGEYDYQYSKPFVCPLCLPGPNLIVDSPSQEEYERCYYANLKEKTLKIGGDKDIGWSVDENGMRVGGDHYRWEMILYLIE